MRRIGRIALAAIGLYALAWIGYVVKVMAGIDLVPGRHFGGSFPGSAQSVRWLRAHV